MVNLSKFSFSNSAENPSRQLHWNEPIVLLHFALESQLLHLSAVFSSRAKFLFFPVFWFCKKNFKKISNFCKEHCLSVEAPKLLPIHSIKSRVTYSQLYTPYKFFVAFFIKSPKRPFFYNNHKKARFFPKKGSMTPTSAFIDIDTKIDTIAPVSRVWKNYSFYSYFFRKFFKIL